MSDIQISVEDRERLAKTKFGEWFDEFFEKKFTEAFDKKFTEARAASRPQSSYSQGQPVEPQATPEHPLPKPRKRSLLEECFSQTFGF